MQHERGYHAAPARALPRDAQIVGFPREHSHERERLEEAASTQQGREKRGLISRLFRRGPKPSTSRALAIRNPNMSDQRQPQLDPRPPQRRHTVMPKVIVESPFAGPDEQTIKRNMQYAREACNHCVIRGENPFASHIFYTQFLDDADPLQRAIGIEMGFARWDDAEKIVFYLDYGLSPGMQKALARAFAMGLPIERRFIRQERRADPIAPGLSIEEALKQMHPSKPEETPNAQDRDTRADRREDSEPAGERSGVDLQRT